MVEILLIQYAWYSLNIVARCTDVGWKVVQSHVEFIGIILPSPLLKCHTGTTTGSSFNPDIL